MQTNLSWTDNILLKNIVHDLSYQHWRHSEWHNVLQYDFSNLQNSFLLYFFFVLFCYLPLVKGHCLCIIGELYILQLYTVSKIEIGEKHIGLIYS